MIAIFGMQVRSYCNATKNLCISHSARAVFCASVGHDIEIAFRKLAKNTGRSGSSFCLHADSDEQTTQQQTAFSESERALHSPEPLHCPAA